MVTQTQAKLIRKLGARKRRDEEGAFIVEGVRLVEELVASGWETEFAVTAPALASTSRGRRLIDDIERLGWMRADASDAELKKLAATDTPQGVLAVVRKRSWQLAEFRPGEEAAVLVFDRVRDPGNVGTLLRTAYALGVNWAVALPGSVDPWNAKTVRATAGAVFRLPVSLEPWPEILTWMRAHDFTILCADPGGEALPRHSEPVGRFALVLGNEPSGLAGDVLASCDRRVAVELPGNMDSLNVAVAGALLLDRLLPAQERSDN
jgi:TrmH family RNA methyltransferase